ncbi:glycosyltransferase [bacterium]|nr:glycosyltransferase [bacterium]
MNKPKISIITASYNYAKYISKTIESMINQTYQNWELIIVDDGSKDNSVEIIKSYCEKDSRIKLFQHKHGVNKGLKETLLLGIKKSTSDWIAFCESDDYYTPTHLEEKVKIINTTPEVKFIFNDYKIEGNKIYQTNPGYVNCKKFLKDKNGQYNYKNDCLKFNPVATFSIVLLKRDLLKNIDFNTPIGQILDYFLWIQIAQKTEFYYLNKELSKCIKHHDSYYTTFKGDKFWFWMKLSVRIPRIFFSRIKRTYFLIKALFLAIL